MIGLLIDIILNLAPMDNLSEQDRSTRMRRIRSINTRPEKLLRKALWMRGLRYRVHYGKEKVDVAFPSKKVAVFVDGCFWHACPFHGKVPLSNCEYWEKKLRRNKILAREKDERLMDQGWRVIHIWEHEFRELETAISRITDLLS